MTRRALTLVVVLAMLPSAAAAQEPPPPRVRDLKLRVVDLVLRVRSPEGARAESPSTLEVAIAADVLFGFNQDTLAPEASALLDRVAEDIRGRAATPVSIVGHTDSIGSDDSNLDLSRRRAKAVEVELRRRLAAADPGFTVEGRGEKEAVAPNANPDGSDNPEGRALNRRVTVSFEKLR